MLGFLYDAWQRFVGNMGVNGPDKGKGGKYLVLPPGYKGKVPDGYFLLKPSTNKNFLFLRGSIKAVSYTPLDVYKRQPMRTPSRPACPVSP